MPLTFSSSRASASKRSIAARSRSAATTTASRQRLANLELAVRARRAAELDRVARDLHRLLQLDVALARLGEVAEMDRRLRAVQVLVDRVGDERRQRREQLRHGQQALAQRPEGRRVPVPEAPARAADVPVRQVVDERGDRPAGGGRVVVVEPLDRPSPSSRSAATGPSASRSVNPSAAGRSLPSTSFTFAYSTKKPYVFQSWSMNWRTRLADRVEREAVAVPRLLRGEVVPAERVRAVRVDHVPRAR